MREKNLPAGAVEIGAEVRKRTGEPPVNEPYLLDVTELFYLRQRTRRTPSSGRARGSFLSRPPRYFP